MELLDKKKVIRESQLNFTNMTRKYLFDAENEKLYFIYKKNIDKIIECFEDKTLDYKEAIDCKRRSEMRYYHADKKLNDLMYNFDHETYLCFQSCKEDAYKEPFECYSYCMDHFAHY